MKIFFAFANRLSVFLDARFGSEDSHDRELARTEWKVRAGFVLGLVCLGGVGVVSYASVVRLDAAAASVSHTQEVLESARAFLGAVNDAETEQRGYIISGDAVYLAPSRRAQAEALEELQRLRALTTDNVLQQERLVALKSLLVRRLEFLEAVAEVRHSNGLDAARRALAAGTGEVLHEDVRRSVASIIGTETALLAARTGIAAGRSALTRAVVIGGCLLALAVLTFTIFGVRRDFVARGVFENAMRNSQNQLEARVSERTAELERTAGDLQREAQTRFEAQEKTQAQLQRLNLLQQITSAIGERQDLQSIYQVAVGALEDHMPLDFCCICQSTAERSVLTVTSVGRRCRTLAGQLGLLEMSTVPIEPNGLLRCMLGQTLYEPELTEVELPLPRLLAGAGLGALVCSPLQAENSVFGVLICARRRERGFSSGECEFLRQLSGHVALAANQARLYEELHTAYDDLRQSQRVVLQQERLRALGQMASGIAHDINNAMAPVMLYTELLLDEEPQLGHTARRKLEMIQRAAGDVAQTVSRMREFYRQGVMQEMLAPVSLNQLASQAAALTQARWGDMAQRRGVMIDMRFELAADMPAILGVESELRDALVNLIFNAVDAMPVGGPLTLRTSIEEGAAFDGPPTRQAILEVEDRGVGMDEETRKRCLEPFFTTKGERGTGLGLAMVYGTMQRHGAGIEIETEPSQGTTLRFRFPVPGPQAVEDALLAPCAVPPLHILVIDDDPLVSAAVCETLRVDGHRVVAADGGQAGIDEFVLACVGDDPYQVVITDLGMPYVDGRKVSAAVRAAAPEVILVMLTGWGQGLRSESDLPPQVDCVLNKPPRRREMREALSRCLEARSASG